MTDPERSAAYTARRKRKHDTVEVIRAASWFGPTGGSARSHKGDTVYLPPREDWDHFDGHVNKAANILGLKVSITKHSNTNKTQRIEVGGLDE